MGAAVMDYGVKPAVHEDYVATTEPPVVESTAFNLVVIVLAIVFSIIGVVLLAAVLFLLVR